LFDFQYGSFGDHSNALLSNVFIEEKTLLQNFFQKPEPAILAVFRGVGAAPVKQE